MYEEFLLGGAFPIGWECVECGKYVSKSEITPEGLGGVVLRKAAHLYAPHGAWSYTGSGERYTEQIIDEDGNLEIIDTPNAKNG